MPQNSFRNIGLRRDQNLGDLENADEGLTNLLNDFATGNDTYISDDLTQAIKTIRSYPVTQDEIIALANITFKNTYYDLDLEASVTAPAIPLVTVKNQFDRIKLEAGQDSYFGGSPFGLQAKFYNTSQLSPVTPGDPDPVTALVGNEVPKDEKQFWLDGEFIWDNKINSQFENQQGAVIWEGYITPEGNGDLFVNIKTTGHLIIQIEDNNGVMQNIVWNDGPSYDFVLANTQSFSTVVSGKEGIMNRDNLKLYTDSARTEPNLYWQGDTRGVDPSNDRISLTDFDHTAAPATLYGKALHPSTHFGQNDKEKSIIIPGFLRFSPRRIKILWWLDEEAVPTSKKFNLSLSVLLGTVINNNYYSTLNDLPSQDPADFPEFKKFYANKLGSDGGVIGTLSDTESIITVGPIDTSDYIPPVNRAAVETLISVGVEYRDSSPIVAQGLAHPGLTLTAAAGNLVLISGSASGRDCTLLDGTYITEILPGSGFILSSPTQGTSIGVTNDVVTTLVDHRGLVDRVDVTVSGTSVTINSSYFGADLVEGMLLITDTGRYDITQVTSPSSFEAVTGAASGIGYIYKDAGILNYTTYNVVTITDLTTLILDTVYGIEPGYYIKSIGKGGTSSLQEVATVDSSTNTITLVSSATANLAEGDSIIAERANADTSAPFSATLTGLTTNTEHLIVENGKIRALDIEFKNFINISTEYSAADDTQYFRLVDILVSDVDNQVSTPYKIIGTSL